MRPSQIKELLKEGYPRISFNPNDEGKYDIRYKKDKSLYDCLTELNNEQKDNDKLIDYFCYRWEMNKRGKEVCKFSVYFQPGYRHLADEIAKKYGELPDKTKYFDQTFKEFIKGWLKYLPKGNLHLEEGDFVIDVGESYNLEYPPYKFDELTYIQKIKSDVRFPYFMEKFNEIKEEYPTQPNIIIEADQYCTKYDDFQKKRVKLLRNIKKLFDDYIISEFENQNFHCLVESSDCLISESFFKMLIRNYFKRIKMSEEQCISINLSFPNCHSFLQDIDDYYVYFLNFHHGDDKKLDEYLEASKTSNEIKYGTKVDGDLKILHIPQNQFFKEKFVENYAVKYCEDCLEYIRIGGTVSNIEVVKILKNDKSYDLLWKNVDNIVIESLKNVLSSDIFDRDIEELKNLEFEVDNHVNRLYDGLIFYETLM